MGNERINSARGNLKNILSLINLFLGASYCIEDAEIRKF
jgi:hypothetical protein